VASSYPEVMGRDKKAFWNRRGSVIKAHMLLLAHLERMGEEVPAQLQVRALPPQRRRARGAAGLRARTSGRGVAGKGGGRGGAGNGAH
jgi:hypothetical protein